jgi:dTDP-4-amino-4,6-dideoxygalactose transaminase
MLPFVDLQAQGRRLQGEIEAAIAAVLGHGRFVMGPEVRAFEEELEAFTGAARVLGCANGTDALMLALAALGVGPGDAVIVPAFTFAATAEAVPWLGAVPAFADVREAGFDLDPEGIAPAAAAARREGLRPVGVIAVDLFGQPADYDALHAAAAALGLWVVADAAQSMGAETGMGAEGPGRKVGTLARLTATSFFPAKPLGCYGDGGAVLCRDQEFVAAIDSLRQHGQGEHRYDHVRIGLNARLDTLQAAILQVKLRAFPAEIEARARIAAAYDGALEGAEAAGRLLRPRIRPGVRSVFAQYTLRLAGGPPGERRDRVARELAAAGIPTMVYYPRPLHRQPAYAGFPKAGALAVSEALAGEVLSLPIHPDLAPGVQARIVEGLVAALS